MRAVKSPATPAPLIHDFRVSTDVHNSLRSQVTCLWSKYSLDMARHTRRVYNTRKGLRKDLHDADLQRLIVAIVLAEGICNRHELVTGDIVWLCIDSAQSLSLAGYLQEKV